MGLSKGYVKEVGLRMLVQGRRKGNGIGDDPKRGWRNVGGALDGEGKRGIRNWKRKMRRRMRSRRIRGRSFRLCMRRVWRDLKDLEAARDQDQEPNKDSEPENFNDGVCGA